MLHLGSHCCRMGLRNIIYSNPLWWYVLFTYIVYRQSVSHTFIIDYSMNHFHLKNTPRWLRKSYLLKIVPLLYLGCGLVF